MTLHFAQKIFNYEDPLQVPVNVTHKFWKGNYLSYLGKLQYVK